MCILRFMSATDLNLITSRRNRNLPQIDVEGLDGRNTDVKDERKIATIADRVSMYPRLLILIDIGRSYIHENVGSSEND